MTRLNLEYTTVLDIWI